MLPDERRNPGFTLIELLVVIAIIAVLAAILFPAFSRARWRSLNATCLSNLRQLGIALHTYAEDNDDHFPVGTDTYWGDTRHLPTPTTKYLCYVMVDRAPAELWHCPADVGFRWWDTSFISSTVEYKPSCFAARGQSYSYNLLFVWNPDTAKIDPFPVSSVQNPSGIAVLTDAHFMWHNLNKPRDPTKRDLSVPPAWNVVYLDGHSARALPGWSNTYTVDVSKWWTQDNNPRQN
jgi:prepilin-type N-terminal cleavage/methylation domain-containing protein